MAADVSSLVRILSRYKEGDEPQKGDLVTRDFLGNCAGLGSSGELDIDLDLKAPFGWEKRLDLVSGKVSLQRRSGSNNSTNSSSGSDPMHRQLQDLNLPPLSSAAVALPPQSLHNLLEDSALDLKLVSSSRSGYQSVCTLDKVKSALERAQRESQKKHQQPDGSPSPTSSSTTVSSIKRRGGSGHEVEVGESRTSTTSEEEGGESDSLMAAGCPSCLLYVLISKGNPRCPRCHSPVPLPALKKPRIDLNSTAAGAGYL